MNSTIMLLQNVNEDAQQHNRAFVLTNENEKIL